MRVEESLGLLVLENDGVEVANLCKSSNELRRRCVGNRVKQRTLRIHGHGRVDESLLERGRHEFVSGTSFGEHCEMHPKPEEIDDRGDDDETEESGGKVLRDVFLFNRRE